MQTMLDYEVVVIGGGPAGATAANDLALSVVALCLFTRLGASSPSGAPFPPWPFKTLRFRKRCFSPRSVAAAWSLQATK